MKLAVLHKIVAINEAKLAGQARVLNDLEIISKQLNIPIDIIGGVALQAHNYNRFTNDIDIIIRHADAKSTGDKLLELGYQFIGSNKFKHQSEFIINLCTDDTKTPQGFTFPTPTAQPGTVGVVSLAELLALKIESNRHKDRSDIIELIKINNITIDFMKDEVNKLIRSPLGKSLSEKLWHIAQSEKS